MSYWELRPFNWKSVTDIRIYYTNEIYQLHYPICLYLLRSFHMKCLCSTFSHQFQAPCRKNFRLLNLHYHHFSFILCGLLEVWKWHFQLKSSLCNNHGTDSWFVSCYLTLNLLHFFFFGGKGFLFSGINSRVGSIKKWA